MPDCSLKLIDEVNVRIEGLDVLTRRKCMNALSFVLPHARHTPSYKLGRWDGRVSYCTIGGMTQIGLLDKLLPIIEDAGYTVEIDDQRPAFTFDIPPIDNNVVSGCLWPTTHPTAAGQPIILKDHQVSAINTFLANPQGIQCLPTSAGKTIVTATLSKVIEHLGRTIIIVPSKQLVRQTLEDYKLLGLDVGVYFGDQKDWDKQHTICTWQSLERLVKRTRAGEVADGWSVADFIQGVVAVICDECHSSKAAVLRKLLTGLFKHCPIRWGLTGTIPKQDYDLFSLTGSIGPVIGAITAKELQDAGILSNCKINIIQTQEQMKLGSYTNEVKYLTELDSRNEWIAKQISQTAKTGNTLVLVNRISHGKFLCDHIKDAVFVSGTMKVVDREDEFKEIAVSDGNVIIATYGVAAVGINIPRIFNLVLIEPGKSFVRTIQSIGRGLRRASDKDFVNIYDICSATKYSKKHLTERKKFYTEQSYPFELKKVII